MDLKLDGATVAIFLAFVQVVFFLGILWNRVTQNKQDIGTIYKKLDGIFEYIRNGRK